MTSSLSQISQKLKNPGNHVPFSFATLVRTYAKSLKSCGHDPSEFARYLFDLKPDLIAEIQHEKKLKRISSLSDFEAIIHDCLTTTEMWKDYTNIFLSKNAVLPGEMRKLLG